MKLRYDVDAAVTGHKDYGIMNKKQSNFIEAHIEKIALAISAIVAIYILYAFVYQSPDDVLVDGLKIPPGEIDIRIAEQSEKLKERLSRDSVPKAAYKPQSVNFLATMNSVLDSNFTVLWPIPGATEKNVDKKYRIPSVGEVNNVEVEHIRAAAYLPKVPITTENVASEEAYEPNDLDLVTVQASFNLAELIDNFQECFAGKEVPESWRDAGLARPVVAGVQLQRQRLDENGQWTQWEDIPRVKIDPGRDEYKIKESVADLPNGGVMVILAKFSDPLTQVSLLQPEGYRIASAEEQWLPPVLHKKYLMVRKEKEAQERRDAATERETKAAEEKNAAAAARPSREERQPASEKSRTTEPTSRTSTSRAGGGYRGGAGGGGSHGAASAAGGRSPAAAGAAARNPSKTTTVRPDRSTDRRTYTTAAYTKKVTKTTVTETTINDEMRKMQLSGRKDISTLKETVTFWAYDDTVVPGESYRYRIRLGIFNPVAGTGQVRVEDTASDNKVVLWSPYSETTDEIDVPSRMYFFPINVQEAAKAVEVQVCKYVLGYWHSEQFMVKRGDTIGRPAKVEVSDKEKQTGVKLPEMIDYSTGSMLVDVVAMNDWFGDKNIQPRQYYDVLFSYDGMNIDRLAAKQMFWPDDVRSKYNELKSLEKKAKEPLRAFGGGLETAPMMGPGMPGDRRGPGDRQQMDEYMRMRIGDRSPDRAPPR